MRFDFQSFEKGQVLTIRTENVLTLPDAHDNDHVGAQLHHTKQYQRGAKLGISHLRACSLRI